MHNAYYKFNYHHRRLYYTVLSQQYKTNVHKIRVRSILKKLLLAVKFFHEEIVDGFSIVEVYLMNISSDRTRNLGLLTDIPWCPALLMMYILPFPLPACRRFSTDSVPPFGSIQSWSPSVKILRCGKKNRLAIPHAQTKVTGIFKAAMRSTSGMRACAPGANICAVNSFRQTSRVMQKDTCRYNIHQTLLQGWCSWYSRVNLGYPSRSIP